MKNIIIYSLFLFITSSTLYAQKCYVWAPDNYTPESRNEILAGKDVDLVVSNDSRCGRKSEVFCANQEIVDALFEVVKKAYPLATMHFIPFKQYGKKETLTDNPFCIMIGISSFEVYEDYIDENMWNCTIGYVISVIDKRETFNHISVDKTLLKDLKLRKLNDTSSARECLNKCFQMTNDELLGFIDQGIIELEKETSEQDPYQQQYASVETTSNPTTKKKWYETTLEVLDVIAEVADAISSGGEYYNNNISTTENTSSAPVNFRGNDWRVYMENSDLAMRNKPVGIPPQLHAQIIQNMNDHAKLNVTQKDPPPGTINAVQAVGNPPYDNIQKSIWLVEVDIENSKRGWRTKNGLFLRPNVITLWEIMRDEKMQSLQLRSKAYNASKSISTKLAKDKLRMTERSRASDQYSYYIDEMYSGNFIKAADHYENYEYHKKEADRMDKERREIVRSHPDYEMDKYEMSYQFKYDNSVPFSQTELQVIHQISQSGYVPNEVWIDFKNSLNQAQKQQLGIATYQ